MKKTILFGAFLIFLIGCSTDKINGTTDNVLDGEWTLVNVSCYCDIATDTDFTTTTLNFNSDKNELTVVNSDAQIHFESTGTFAYTLNNNEFTLPSGRSYQFKVNENNLQLVFLDNPQIADDEISYGLVR